MPKLMVTITASVTDLDAKIIRLFRIYGPRMKLADDQMIPDFINNALEGADLEIFGARIFLRAFCYISDCLDACLKMMDSESTVRSIWLDIEINLTDLAERLSPRSLEVKDSL